ncbi:hypothetical protein OROGR_025143 [Orobanche gracilis]
MAHLLVLFITITIFPFPTLSQTTGKLTVGASINATESSKPWLSSSGDFAFGFRQLKNNNTFYALSIWFARIPDETIVWFDRSSYPVPRGSILQLDAVKGLVLQKPDQGNLLYITDGLPHKVAYALLNDTGNLVLLQTNSAPLWQSFENPADTILPTQTIEINGSMLNSRKTQNDFSHGRFYAGMNAGGNFVLNTKSVYTNVGVDDEYYNSNSNSGARILFDKSPDSASISVVSSDGHQTNTILDSNLPPSEYYYRATLDFDGLFSMYHYPKKFDSSSLWVSVGSLPAVGDRQIRSSSLEVQKIIDSLHRGAVLSWEAYVHTVIRSSQVQFRFSFADRFQIRFYRIYYNNNNVCSIENGRPACHCPRGFSLVDPNNAYGACKSNFTMSCNESGQDTLHEVLDISDVDWPFNDYEQIMPSSKDDCRDACVSDCFCGAAIFRSQSCWKKRLPLSNGRVDTTLGATAFLKVRKSS